MSVLFKTRFVRSTRLLPSSCSSSSKPGVSVMTTGPSGSSSIAFCTGSVVVPGRSETTASDVYKRQVHTASAVCLGLGVILFALCFCLARPLLTLLGTKEELIDGAILYMRIYAFGLPAMALYNFGSAVLTASGDTKRPLILSLIHISRQIRNVGQLYSSASREATMPTTPWCHVSSARTIAFGAFPAGSIETACR